MINPYYLQIRLLHPDQHPAGIEHLHYLVHRAVVTGQCRVHEYRRLYQCPPDRKAGPADSPGPAGRGLLAAVMGLLIGLPTLRLTGVYLAIATLGFGEVVRVVFINWESLTSGAVGIAGIPHLGRTILARLQAAGFSPESWGLKNNEFISLTVFLILLFLTLLTLLFFSRLLKSRVGRAFQAIRMDEKAAEAMGIHTTYYKILTFAQGAALAGFAGALFAHVTGYISPADFTYHRAVEILVFAVFGGSEVLWGTGFRGRLPDGHAGAAPGFK